MKWLLWCLQAEAEQRAREAASASKLAPVEEREEPATEQPAAAEVSQSLKARHKEATVDGYPIFSPPPPPPPLFSSPASIYYFI